MNEIVDNVSDRAGSFPADMDRLPDFDEEVSLRELAMVPLKRKRTIITCALLGLLAAIFVTFAMTPRYRATAIIELSADKQGGVIALDDLASAATGGADELKAKMQTEIAVIKDNSIALAVMAKLGMLRVGKSGLFSSGAERVVSEDALAPKQREQLIQAFEGHLKVEEVESSRLIAITYTSKDPLQAANVANQVVAEYNTYLLRSNLSSSKEVSQWLAGQLSGLSDRVTKSEQTVADFERTHNLAQNDLTLAEENERAFKPALASQAAVTSKMNDDILQLGVLMEQARSSRELYDLLYAKLQEENINSGSSATNVTIADPARPPGAPWMPQPVLFAGAGLGGGLLFGLGLAFLLESQDDTAADTFQAEALTGVPVLGLVPFHKSDSKTQPVGALATESSPFLVDSKGATAESLRNLRSVLLLSGVGRKLKTLSFTSALPEEGRSYTVYNLGLAFAATGRKVLIIDADLHRSQQHVLFRVGPREGLAEILAGAASFDDVLLKHPVDTNLSLLSAGRPSPLASEMLGSGKIAGIIDTARDRFDIVLVDNAPVLPVADAMIVSTYCDGVIGVLRAGSTSQKALRRFVQALARNQVRVLGIVIEAVDMSAPEYRSVYGYDVQSYYGAK